MNRKRQEINEPIKGQWGYDHTNLKVLSKIIREMALIMTVYNIKHSLNILDIYQLVKKLHHWSPDYGKVICIAKNRLF